MTIALSVKQISAPPLPLPSERAKLKRELRAAQLKKKLMALTLIAPLAVFLLIIFIVPIAVLLVRGVENPEVAGSLLVFILALGYYITPALLGGPNEQMVSYYVAYFTNVTINWGMACALGSLLLAATLVLYAVYQRFTQTAASQ